MTMTFLELFHWWKEWSLKSFVCLMWRKLRCIRVIQLYKCFLASPRLVSVLDEVQFLLKICMFTIKSPPQLTDGNLVNYSCILYCICPDVSWTIMDTHTCIAIVLGIMTCNCWGAAGARGREAASQDKEVTDWVLVGLVWMGSNRLVTLHLQICIWWCVCRYTYTDKRTRAYAV